MSLNEPLLATLRLEVAVHYFASESGDCFVYLGGKRILLTSSIHMCRSYLDIYVTSAIELCVCVFSIAVISDEYSRKFRVSTSLFLCPEGVGELIFHPCVSRGTYVSPIFCYIAWIVFTLFRINVWPDSRAMDLGSCRPCLSLLGF